MSAVTERTEQYNYITLAGMINIPAGAFFIRIIIRSDTIILLINH